MLRVHGSCKSPLAMGPHIYEPGIPAFSPTASLLTPGWISLSPCDPLPLAASSNSIRRSVRYGVRCTAFGPIVARIWPRLRLQRAMAYCRRHSSSSLCAATAPTACTAAATGAGAGRQRYAGIPSSPYSFTSLESAQALTALVHRPR